MVKGGIKLEGMTVTLSSGDSRFCLAVDDLSLEPSAIMALTGESGAGKTLLLEVLGLMRAPSAGGRYTHTNTDGSTTDLAGLWQGGANARALTHTRGAIFGFVPQTGGLLNFLSVHDNIALPQRLTGRLDARWIETLLKRMGLSEQADLRPSKLSVGQRQRVAIARALAHRPAFVIADEPTAALDPERSEDVLQLFLQMAAENGCGVLLSSHEVDRIDRLGLSRLHLAVTRDGDTTVSRLRVGAPR
jgi:putative ABC transport system ATP-binding protein